MTAARSSHPLLLGHRGARARKSIPENSVASFDQAMADGCDGFEFDVRLTADRVAVICHDPEIQGIEIARASAQQVPGLAHLEDVLARYQERAFLDIELKVSGVESIVVALLRKYPPRRGLVVSSFLPEVLHTVRTEDSTIPLGLICETRSELTHWNQAGVEYVIPHQNLADRALMMQVKGAGRKILVWTVNAPAAMRHFAELGVEGIVSDETSLLHRTLSG